MGSLWVVERAKVSEFHPYLLVLVATKEDEVIGLPLSQGVYVKVRYRLFKGVVLMAVE